MVPSPNSLLISKKKKKTQKNSHQIEYRFSVLQIEITQNFQIVKMYKILKMIIYLSFASVRFKNLYVKRNEKLLLLGVRLSCGC